MISSSSRSSRTKRTMLKPDRRATSPRTPNTKIAHVPQKVTMSRPRLASEALPNTDTVYAMPPKAPSGAAHMMRRMTPKMIRESVSNTRTTARRSRSARNETAAATSSAMISTRRISLLTNGPAIESGNRSPVMNPTRPWSPPASPICAFAASRPAALAPPRSRCRGRSGCRR